MSTTLVRISMPLPEKSSTQPVRKKKALHTPDPEPGDVFGRLKVIRFVSSTKGYRKFLAICSCGTEKIVDKSGLTSGNIQSCGCLRREVSKSAHTKHGATGTVEHCLWMAMIARCECPTNRQYNHYGARGISVSDAWKTFDGFYADMGDRPSDGATLERVNNDGNYEKSNVIWADRTAQANNRRSSVRWEYKGEMYTLKELAALSGLNLKVLEARLYCHKWPVEKAVETPLMPAGSRHHRNTDKLDALPSHKLYPQT